MSYIDKLQKRGPIVPYDEFVDRYNQQQSIELLKQQAQKSNSGLWQRLSSWTESVINYLSKKRPTAQTTQPNISPNVSPNVFPNVSPNVSPGVSGGATNISTSSQPTTGIASSTPNAPTAPQTTPQKEEINPMIPDLISNIAGAINNNKNYFQFITDKTFADLNEAKRKQEEGIISKLQKTPTETDKQISSALSYGIVRGSPLALFDLSGKLGGYEPKTFLEKAIYYPTYTATFIATAAEVGGLSLIKGIATDATKTFLKNRFISQAIKFFEDKFPNWLKFILTGKNTEQFIRDSINLGVSLGITNQLTQAINSPIKDRISSAVSSAASVPLLGRLGLIEGAAPRIGIHAAFGFLSSLKESPDIEKAYINSAIWGIMGAMGGTRATMKQIEGALVNDSLKNLEKLPKVDVGPETKPTETKPEEKQLTNKESVEQIKSFLKDAGSIYKDDKSVPSSFVFVSPNTKENATLDYALKMLDSPKQKSFNGAVAKITKDFGVEASVYRALGEWVDGAENSTYVEFKNLKDQSTVEYLAALKGLLGYQKSSAYFIRDDNGNNMLYFIDFPKNKFDIKQVIDIINKEGIQFKTIIPDIDNYYRLAIIDTDGTLEPKVYNIFKNHGETRGYATRGNGKFIGEDTREKAAEVFKNIIKATEATPEFQRNYGRQGYSDRLLTLGYRSPKDAVKVIKNLYSSVEAANSEVLKRIETSDAIDKIKKDLTFSVRDIFGDDIKSYLDLELMAKRDANEGYVDYKLVPNGFGGLDAKIGVYENPDETDNLILYAKKGAPEDEKLISNIKGYINDFLNRGDVSFERKQAATLSQKSYVKYVLSYTDFSPSIINKAREEIDKAKSSNELWTILDRSLDNIANNIIKLARDGDSSVFNNIRLEPKSLDTEKMSKIIDAFKETDGSIDGLRSAVSRVLGAKTTRDANSLIKEFGFGNVNDLLHSFLIPNYKNEFGEIMRNSMSYDVVSSKAKEDVVRYEMEEKNSPSPFAEFQPRDVEYLEKHPDNLVGDWEPTNIKENKIKTETQIISDFLRVLNVAYRKGGLSPGVKGEAYLDQFVKQKHYDFKNFLHETGGHIVDAMFNITDTMPNSPAGRLAQEEIIDNLVGTGVMTQYPKEQWASEGFAKMMADWLSGSPKMEEKYPHTFAYMKELITAKEPAVWDFLNQARIDYIMLQDAPSLERMRLNIRAENEQKLTDNIKKTYKDEGFGGLVRKTWNWIENAYMDQLNVFRRFKEFDNFWSIFKPSQSIYNRVKTLNERINGAIKWFIDEGAIGDINAVLNFESPRRVRNSFLAPGLHSIWNEIPVELRNHAGAYLTAKEFKTRIQKDLDSGKKDITVPSDYTPDNIESAIRDAKRLIPGIEKFENDIEKLNNAIRKMMVDGGLITEELYNKITKYPRLTPLLRRGGIFNNDFSFNVAEANTIYRPYFGSTRPDLVDPYISQFAQIASTIRDVFVNDTLSRIYQYASKKPSALASVETNPQLKPINITIDEAIKIIKLYHDYTEDEIKSIRKDLEDNPELLKMYRVSVVDPNVHPVMINGEIHYLRLDPKLMDAIQATRHYNSFGATMTLFSKFTNFKRELATTLSPIFWVNNVPRDTITAMGRAENFFVPFVDNFRGFKHLATKDDVYDVATLYGLGQSGLVAENLDYIKRQLRTEKSKGFNFLEFMRNISQYSELSTRLGVLGKHKLDSPDNIASAMIDAFDATIHWRTRGLSTSETTRINRVAAFFKANILATTEEAKTLFQHPIRTTKRFAWMPVLQLLIALSQYDPEKKDFKPEYKQLPLWRRLSGINIPIPGTNKFFYLPILGNTYYTTFGVLPEILIRRALGKDPAPLKDEIVGIIDNLLPFRQGGIDNLGMLAFNAIPDVVKPALENAFNYSAFLGRTIIPEYLNGVITQEQYDKSTSNIAIIGSRALKQIGIDVAPLRIDYYLRNVAFGTYDLLKYTSDFAAHALGLNKNILNQKMSALDLPIIRSYIKQEFHPSQAASVSRFIDRYHELEKTNKTISRFSNQDITMTRDFVLENIQSIKNYGIADSYYKFIKELIAQYDMIDTKKDMDDKEKQRNKNQIRDKIFHTAEVANEFLDMLE